ncbi:PREDICTED: uncharacterized protein LOC107063850 [Polistes dominula]|uniref:Uncharacterized protein LOC107063850 n=1 Tax=Polistes dominula TaxID=743375 RepID=A0ABM1HU19_POLDO|nr:PREDICTED: uncharacterized protein LOC107063850 [Polistes dominula]
MTEELVKALELIPSTISSVAGSSTSNNEMFNTSGTSTDTSKPLTDVQVVSPSNQTFNPSSKPLCPYSEATNICDFKCLYFHGNICDLCSCAALHQKFRKQHTNTDIQSILKVITESMERAVVCIIQNASIYSLLGIVLLISKFSNKIIDVIVKSSICKACQYLATKNPIEAESLSEDHKNECTTNHEGSNGKMEVDSVSEIFKRSEERYGLKYVKYIVQTARNYVDTVDNARILRAKNLQKLTLKRPKPT